MEKNKKIKSRHQVKAIDPHIVFFLVCLFALFAFIFYLINVSKGSYLIEKFQFRADKLTAGIDLRSASDEKLASVIASYRKAIEKNPLSKRAGRIHLSLAQIYIDRGEYEKALKELKTAINNFSGSNQLAGEARFAIGKIYERKGEWENALKAFEEVLFHNPLSQKGLLTPLYIAEYYKKNAMPKKAKEAYDRAVQHYRYKLDELGDISHAAILRNFVALAYSSQGLWEKAVGEWELILTKYPKSRLVAPTLLALGEAYAVRLKERTKAVDHYSRLIKEYPKTDFALDAKVRLIQLYFFTSDYESARHWCEEVLKDKKSKTPLRAEVALILARSHEKEGNWEEAEKTYDAVLKTYPDTLAALRVPIIKARHFQVEEANVEEANRLYGEALLNYQRLADEGGTDSLLAINAQDLISMTYVSKQDWPALLTHIDQLIEAAQNEDRKAQLHFLKASIVANKLKDTAAAEGLYKTFLSKYAANPLAGYAKQELDKLQNPPVAVVAESTAPEQENGAEKLQPIQNKEVVENLEPVEGASIEE